MGMMAVNRMGRNRIITATLRNDRATGASGARHQETAKASAGFLVDFLAVPRERE